MGGRGSRRSAVQTIKTRTLRLVEMSVQEYAKHFDFEPVRLIT